MIRLIRSIDCSTRLARSSRPIFMQNLCAFWGMSKDPCDRLAVFVAFGARGANAWLDKVKISNSDVHLRWALVLYRMLNHIARFDVLQEPLGGLKETHQLYRRLKGILDPNGKLR